MEIATSMEAESFIRILERVVWCSGKPESIRVDNGPEFIADFTSTFNRAYLLKTASVSALMAAIEEEF